MKSNYGLDGPDYIFGFLILGIMELSAYYFFNQTILIWLALGSFTISFGLTMTSRVGKVVLAKQVVKELALKGNEWILDVGCGKGLYLIESSRFLKTGKAYGLDIWKKRDQLGNKKEATLQNARIEGVEQFVEVIDGDMRSIPLKAGLFDIVFSSLAIHNVPKKEGKLQTLSELARVTKPGGIIVILDFRLIPFYASVFKELGWEEVQVSKRKLLTFPPHRMMQARKPQ